MQLAYRNRAVFLGLSGLPPRHCPYTTDGKVADDETVPKRGRKGFGVKRHAKSALIMHGAVPFTKKGRMQQGVGVKPFVRQETG
jgi:hypothetical protein